MGPEQPRPFANTDEPAYTLTVEDALLLYENAGHGRTARAIQKYCSRGDLDCIKEETRLGQRYRITPPSVSRHLEQIEQISQTHEREQSRSGAFVRDQEIEEIKIENTDEHQPHVREQSPPFANDHRYVSLLESDNEFLREQIARKDHQIEARDNQIEAMIERDRETNVLIQGLQQRIPQLSQGHRFHESELEERPERNRPVVDEMGDNSELPA